MTGMGEPQHVPYNVEVRMDDQPDREAWEQMMTEDHRCGQCGELVTDWEAEPHHESTDRGFVETLSVATTLKPCGHVFVKAVR